MCSYCLYFFSKVKNNHNTFKCFSTDDIITAVNKQLEKRSFIFLL